MDASALLAVLQPGQAAQQWCGDTLIEGAAADMAAEQAAEAAASGSYACCPALWQGLTASSSPVVSVQLLLAAGHVCGVKTDAAAVQQSAPSQAQALLGQWQQQEQRDGAPGMAANVKHHAVWLASVLMQAAEQHMQNCAALGGLPLPPAPSGGSGAEGSSQPLHVCVRSCCLLLTGAQPGAAAAARRLLLAHCNQQQLAGAFEAWLLPDAAACAAVEEAMQRRLQPLLGLAPCQVSGTARLLLAR
jgi:hypothetical protein